MADRIKKYNPAFLSPEELVRSFVVRHSELELIVQVIRENVAESNQHVLVIGPRGIGKTMLALRVVEEIRGDEDLAAKWYPLVFSEESYLVRTPGEFWLEALFHLAHKTKEKKWSRTYEELRNERNEERLQERALTQLMDFSDGEGKRILLVVENFNMLLGEQMSSSDAWKLRHTLLHEQRVMLLATATHYFRWEKRGALGPEIKNSGKAMFELFKIYELVALDEDECGELWASVSGKKGSDERVRPLQILTGGNPRLLAIISTFAVKMSLKELMDDLMQLVDDHTEYFKTHLESLPTVERRVYLGLAELWDPVPARKVAEVARLEVSKTSSLLKRLIERGVVVEANGERRAKLYQVSERMYNIYYLMRRRGGPSRRVKGLVRFIVPFYEPKELVGLTRRIAEEACELGPELRREYFWFYEGILESTSTQLLREMIIKAAPPDFFEIPEIPASIKCLVEPEKVKEVEAVEARVVELLKEGENLEKADKLEEAKRVYQKAIEIDPQNATLWGKLGMLLDERLGRYEEAEKTYRRAIELNPEYVEAWAKLGMLLQDHTNRYEEAEQVYRKVIDLLPESNFGWGLLAYLLHEYLERHEEAERAYRKAIEFAPEDVFMWVQLGRLLYEHFERYEEAEEVFRKVVKLKADYAWGWVSLGCLLHLHLEQYEEAEKSYRKAIELDPHEASGWGLLGDLLHEHSNRYEETEQAYRKALELAPEAWWGWLQLGRLLQNCFERYEEAEQAYSKVIKLKPENVLGWLELGLLLQDHLERYEDAEQAFRKVIELAPQKGDGWALLGLLFQISLERYDEAEQAYRKVIELEPKQALGWFLLGQLFGDRLERYEEAEKAYRKAIEFDPLCPAWKALIFLLQEKLGRQEEVLEILRKYLEDADLVNKTVDDAIEVFVALAADGYGQEALEILQDSPGGKILEPLVVGLRLFVGEDVKAAAEIMEVGKDVVKRIQERHDKMKAERTGKRKSAAE